MSQYPSREKVPQGKLEKSARIALLRRAKARKSTELDERARKDYARDQLDAKIEENEDIYLVTVFPAQTEGYYFYAISGSRGFIAQAYGDLVEKGLVPRQRIRVLKVPTVNFGNQTYLKSEGIQIMPHSSYHDFLRKFKEISKTKAKD